MNLYTYCRNNPIRYVDPSGHSYATLPNGDKMSINSASDAKKFEEKKARMKKGAPGCSHGECSIDGVLVVAKEGKPNGKRFNATITVYSPDGTETSFVGSTLPDEPSYIDSNNEPSVAVDPGIYKINKAVEYDEKGREKQLEYLGAQYYRVSPLNDDWYLPSRNLHPDHFNEFYYATGILIHRGEKKYEYNPWSTGCITIEGVDNMNKFADLVGSSATLVIKRS